MAIRILTLPFDPVSDSFDDGPLSDFLRGKHIQRIDPHFFQQDGCGFWTVLVEYTPVLDDPPVRGRDAEVLSDTEQRLFDALRIWRKEAAEKAGVPVYVIATNRQLHLSFPRSSVGMQCCRSSGTYGHATLERRHVLPRWSVGARTSVCPSPFNQSGR